MVGWGIEVLLTVFSFSHKWIGQAEGMTVAERNRVLLELVQVGRFRLVFHIPHGLTVFLSEPLVLVK
jgi:hypothetical protein